jgi:hypothetical protein
MAPDNDARSLEKKIDALINELTANPANEEERSSGERVKESWQQARELVCNVELRALLLVEAGRIRKEQENAESPGEESDD